MSEQKSRRTAADNTYLCAHAFLQQPFHFRDQIVLGHAAGPVGALVEIVPRRSAGVRAIKNQLLVDRVLREQILIEPAHGAAQYVFLLEVVFLVELFGGRELHLQQPPSEVDLEQSAALVEVGFGERRWIEQHGLLGQPAVHLIDERTADSVEFDRPARAQFLNLCALVDQFAVAYGDRVNRRG